MLTLTPLGTSEYIGRVSQNQGEMKHKFWLGDLHSYEGKQVRPENIHVGSGDIELPILVREPLGHETVFHLKSGLDTIVAKVQAEEIAGIEDSAMVDFELQKAYLFDGVSEERIRC